ncbi:stage II sporulation protein SpoIID [Synergistales bacterium]|nr:stage II sporulation protein SpoIID [Synergistales bacterium]
MSFNIIKTYLRKNIAYIIPAAAALLILFIFIGRAHSMENFTIKIGVGRSVSSGKLLGSGLSLRDARGNTVRVSGGASVSSAGSSRIKAGGHTLSLPVSVSASQGLGWNETRYRGTLGIIAAGGAFTVVNTLPVEDYLRGVLKIEMNDTWPMEALKAQAILARTYAARNKGRFAKNGYDLDDTTNSQAYRGVNAETPRTDMAVSDTRGQVLTWNGSLADVYFHSDSGGATADMGDVWGGAAPYLKPQREKFGYTSPYSSWRLVLTPAQVASVLRKIGKDVGSVSSVEVGTVDPHGRVVLLRIRGSKGTAAVRSHEFRTAVGSNALRSTVFTINGSAAGSASLASVPEKKTQQTSVAASGGDTFLTLLRSDVFSTDELMDLLKNPQKREEYIKTGLDRLEKGLTKTKKNDAPETRNAPAPANNTPPPSSGFVFTGRGWGHGVGLSQWGAKTMADNGMNCESILAHYFQGTRVAR